MVLFVSSNLYADNQNKEMSIGKMEGGASIFDLTHSGSPAWEVHGSTAEFVNDGYVKINDVEAIFYGNAKKDDKVTVTSSCALVNQSTKKVKTDQPVVIVSNQMIITGEGLKGDLDKKVARIMHNVKVVLQGDHAAFFFSVKPDNGATYQDKENEGSDL